MFRYLAAAFFARPRIPGFGNLPLNLMGVTAFTLLGFANPAFWLLGLGVETGYLSMTATNRRFQNVVDAGSIKPLPPQRPRPAQPAAPDLSPAARRRLSALDDQINRVQQLYGQLRVDDFLASGNREALATLRTHYARLLAAQEGIERHWSGDPDELRGEIETLQRDLSAKGMTEDLRTSRMKTLEILQVRLENQSRKESMLAEMESELHRIEAQIELAVENAAMSSQPSSISTDLAVDLTKLDPRIFGIDEPITAPGRSRTRTRQRESS